MNEQEQQEQIAKDEAEAEVLGADTAFVVFVQDGMAYATNDLGTVEVTVQGQKLAIEPMRKAGPDDLYRYSMEVAKDVQIAQTATKTAMQMFEITKQLQEQQAAEQGKKKIHTPGS